MESSSNISKEHEKCEDTLAHLLQTSPRNKFILEKIEDLGCKLPPNFFACRPCHNEISGGFGIRKVDGDGKTVQPQIIVCENKSMDLKTFFNTVTHELIHAYDVCRAKMDYDNCMQHACTEIRASSLSGECDMAMEMHRGHMKIQGGHQECVKRRATLSVSMNPTCKNVAEESVARAMKKCYNDTKPFDDHI
eukprot:gene40639-49548_t